MPDRIVRAGIITSDRINSLSWASEVFYRRLLSLIDDYGRFDARASVLRTQLYPLKIDRVSESDIAKWMGDCSKAGLIRLYTVNNKPYLEVGEFNQRLRAKNSKFPEPLEDCGHVPAYDSHMTADATETNSDTYTETETETEQPGSPKSYDKFFSELPEDYALRWEPLLSWFKEHKPKFFKPYLDLWNVFAVLNKIIVRDQLPIDKRKGKFKIRVKEPGFNFTAILGKIKESDFLKGENERKWKVDIDFILDSENNYIKILEGKYDNKN